MPRPRPILALLVLALTALGATACGDDGADVGGERADQVRAAAIEAGLPAEVADVLALAAQGPTATFQITYAGTDGALLVVSQEPPNRRIDVVSNGTIIESRVLRDGTGYRCELGAGSAGALECRRAAGALEAPGAFTAEALGDFTDDLAASLDELDLTVEDRTVADTDATCLVTAPRTGTTIDLDGPGVETLCVSEAGAQLLVDAGGERLVAQDYATEVPEGTFDV